MYGLKVVVLLVGLWVKVFGASVVNALDFSSLASECRVVSVGRTVVVVVGLGFDLVVIRFRNSVFAVDLFDADASG